MKAYKKCWLLGILFLILTTIKAQPPQVAPSLWQATVVDDFNGTDIDGNMWNRIFGYGQPDQYACRTDNNTLINPGSNLQVTGGVLSIITKPETYNCGFPHWDSLGADHPTYETKAYTTGMIISKKLYRYGYYEIRCRKPLAFPGIGPNFWLYAENTTCDLKYSEIDLFEYSPDNQSDEATYNLHFNPVAHVGIGYSAPSTTRWTIGDSDYHIYGIEWTPERLAFYIDGTYIGQLTNNTYNSFNETPADLTPMHIIADVNVNYTTTAFGLPNMINQPHYYDIDYIKVYKKNYPVRPTSMHYISSGFNPVWGSGYWYGISNYTIQNGGGLQVIAENNITLEPGFSVNPGGTFKAYIGSYDDNTTNPCGNLPKPLEPISGADFRLANTTFNDNNTAAISVSNSETINNSLTVSPNPTTGTFRISIPASSSSASLTIDDMLGARVYESTLSGSQDIDLSKYGNGVYILRSNVNGDIKTQKIILNK